LAVRNIFVLSVQEGGHRLVFAIRRDDEFDRSGNHLQTSQFLPERTRDGAQGRPRIGTRRNRASPQAAHILPDAFVPWLSNRNHRYRNLGLRGPTASSRSLNAREKAPAVLGSRRRSPSCQSCLVGEVRSERGKSASLNTC